MICKKYFNFGVVHEHWVALEKYMYVILVESVWIFNW